MEAHPWCRWVYPSSSLQHPFVSVSGPCLPLDQWVHFIIILIVILREPKTKPNTYVEDNACNRWDKYTGSWERRERERKRERRRFNFIIDLFFYLFWRTLNEQPQTHSNLGREIYIYIYDSCSLSSTWMVVPMTPSRFREPSISSSITPCSFSWNFSNT